MTAAERLAEAQLRKITEDRENQRVKDEMLFKGKIQEGLSNSRFPWPKYSEKQVKKVELSIFRHS